MNDSDSDTAAALRRWLPVEPLTAAAFTEFGEVIDAAGRRATTINQGTTLRFGDLARIDVMRHGGRPTLAIYRATARALPLRIAMLERHALGSQAFVPLAAQPFLIVVAPPSARPSWDRVRCFRASSGQGANLARGVWHHPLIALQAGDFLVLERAAAPGSAVDCEEAGCDVPDLWVDGC